MKLSFCDPSFALFASDALDDVEEPPTSPTPVDESPAIVGLKEYVSAVHVRAAARSMNVKRRRSA